MDSTLVLVRHGESEWNKLNLFTGWKDVDLTEQGVAEAHRAGRLMHAQGMKFDIAYTSLLKRANRTLEIILSELSQADLQTIRDEALNERDYGELTGLNKDDARERWGEEQVLIWRRSFDIPPPGGESLKGTAARVLPYFDAHIKPQLDAGKSIIVAAHGNSLRALLMQLEQLTPEEILKVNIATGAPLVYRLGSGGAILEKRELVA